MDARWAIAALLAATVVLVSIQPIQPEDSPPSPSSSPHPWSGMQYGLGLEVPDELPEPGPFAEGSEAMARLEDFMRFEIPRVVEQQCGIEGMSLEDALGGEERLRTISVVYDICESHLRGGDKAMDLNGMNELSRWVLSHLENGTVEEAYAAERDAAMHSLQQTLQALDAAPTPADSVEAQLLAWFAAKTEWDSASLDTAMDLYASYQDKPDFWSIENAFLNLHGPKHEARLTRTLMDAYPWQNPGCTPNQNPEVIKNRVFVKYELALDLNQRPEENLDFTPAHQFILNLEPKLELYAERGWWPGLLWLEQIFDWWIAVGTHMDGVEAYPTQEEGAYLVQAYRNHTRTLSTDYILEFLHPEALRYTPWDGNPAMVAQSLHVDSLTWRFGDVGCVEVG